MLTLFRFRLLVAARLVLFLPVGLLGARGAAGQGAPIPGLPHWQWQNPLPTGYDLTDSHVFNDSTAIAVGAHGTAIKTRDGGRSWQVLNVGTATPIVLAIVAIPATGGTDRAGDATTQAASAVRIARVRRNHRAFRRQQKQRHGHRGGAGRPDPRSA